MDLFDKRILKQIQRDSSLSIGDIASNAGLSQTPCWRRIRKLEEAGVIERRVALLSPASLNLNLTAFMSVKAGRHDEAWFADFAAGVKGIEEIVELYRMSGDIDYLLKVVVTDMAHFDQVYKRLIAVVDFSDVTSTFAMEEIKRTTELPLVSA